MTPELWSPHALIAAAAAEADGPAPPTVSGFSIDTRTLAPGDVFVALKDSRDGHDFVSAAFAAGAAGALVSTAYTRQAGDGWLLRVDDPLRALERIGVAARARLSPEARVVAVTGSAGKTGTKEMLRSCLSAYGATHAPDKSFNNHWGVPLTLARMPAATRYGVLEIGMNHAGEITPLTRMVRPHIAVITNVLPVHVGNFPDGEAGVAAAKAEIMLGVEPGGTVVLPRDNPHFPYLAARAGELGLGVVSFGTAAGSDVRAREIEARSGGTVVTIGFACRSARFEVGAPGVHLATNALAVAAVIDRLGLPIEAALGPLARIAAPEGRGARSIFEVAGGRILLIDESYNANPGSVSAALAAMATVPRAEFPRRVVVLGDMLELGERAEALHLSLYDPIDAAGADLVFASGPMMRRLFEQLPPHRRGDAAASSIEIVPHVLAAVRPGDVVMVKGSLGSRMGPVVAALRKAFGA